MEIEENRRRPAEAISRSITLPKRTADDEADGDASFQTLVLGATAQTEQADSETATAKRLRMPGLDQAATAGSAEDAEGDAGVVGQGQS